MFRKITYRHAAAITPNPTAVRDPADQPQATGLHTRVPRIQASDFQRIAELIETYADFPLGGTDASLIAIGERLAITTVATLDRRHFQAVRPRHRENFDLVP